MRSDQWIRRIVAAACPVGRRGGAPCHRRRDSMRLALAGAAAAAVILVSAPAAHASDLVPYIHLTVGVTGPYFGDSAAEMFYDLTVDSSADSEATATGLVLKLTELSCPAPATPDVLCEHRATFWEPVSDVPPGGHVAQVLPVSLPDTGSEVWLRLTPEIAHADQLIR